MRIDLSSRIKLDHVSKRYYRPESELELASLTRYEKIYTKILATSREGATDVAQDIAKQIERCVNEKGRCTIAFDAGKCALDVYDELVKLYFADKVSFASVVAFNISELGMGGGYDGSESTLNRLNDHLFKKVDIDPANIHTFNEGADKSNVHKLCKQYETTIDEYGGIDLVICQLTRNGGLAFNDQGTQTSSSCRLVLLSSESRQRIADTCQCSNTPSTAVTLGLSNLLAAGRIYCVAWGEDCATAAIETIEGKLSDQVPASCLQLHHNVKLVLDLDAATQLTRISTPWRVTSCEWTDQMVRRAIVWLSAQTSKPILKLTNKDYNDNGLGELVSVFGSGYDVNIKIFNAMQHTITGWPGGKPNADDTSRPERATPYPKRVLIFSPRPDDAVVSMGGTMRRLVQQGHEVHVAFQTSGDVAVDNEDMYRTLMLNNKIITHFNLNDSRTDSFVEKIRKELLNKRPGEPNSPHVRFIKGAILVCEGVMGCQHMGIKSEHIHEMSMPFYNDDAFGVGKVSEADVTPIIELIKKISPHQIFFANDFNDPMGTHLRATNALLAAIDQLKGHECLSNCRMWMYRGQWGAWEAAHIEMAVPMSPEEFSYKREGILKYQSQMSDAPFRDPEDGELSWQRSVERNQAAASIYEQLGLASYEAMETFVQYHPTATDS